MKIKFVFWGMNVQDECILVVVELLVDDNQVKIYIFFDVVVIDEFYQKMMDDWCNDKEVEFLEVYMVIEWGLNVVDLFLFESIKVECSDLVICV